MENKTNLELYLLNCEKIRDFCFFKKMKIEETEEFKKINELIPSVIKEKYLYSYSKNNNLSFSTYLSNYKGNISALHTKLKSDGPNGGIVLLDLEQKHRDKDDLIIKNLFSSNLGEVKFLKDNDKDKACNELLENLKVIENKIKKEAVNFINGDGEYYSEYQKLHQENDKYIKSFENLILPKFLEESFLNNFIKELDNHFLTFLEKNLKFRIIFTDNYFFSNEHKKVVRTLKIHFFLSNYDKENYFLNSVNHAIGVLEYNPIDKQIGWECFCLDNIKYLKKKISVVKWCRNNLKKILIDNIDFEKLFELKEV